MSKPETKNAGTGLAERYRVLLDIGHKLTRTLSAEELYHSIYKETSRVLETTGFYVALYDREADRATVVFYADRGVERDVEISYKGSESDVLRLGQSTVVLDRAENLSLMVLGEEGTELTRSAISVPLLYEGVVIGALSTQSYNPNAYTREDLELFQAIADLAVVAITNSQHFTELVARRREAEQIEEIGRAIAGSLDPKEVLRSVNDAVLDLLQADASTVWLLEGGHAKVASSLGKIRLQEGTIWQLSDGLMEAVVTNRRPIIVEDLSKSQLIPQDLAKEIRAGSLLLVPLVLEDEVAGGLSASRVEKGPVSPQQVEVLLRLASQTTVALANARLHENIRNLSLTDPLTDLPNRRHLDMHLRREVAAARRGRPVCVVVFDLNDFKGHNDRLGHVVGDQILRYFGRILLSETRAMNLAARYGGDEFITVLTDVPRGGAESHATRVENRVAAHPELSKYGLTVSYGIAEFDPIKMFEVEDLVQAADQDLYRAKEARGKKADPPSEPTPPSELTPPEDS
jgi:diguanylate cyclase (GGDEF)-like protein